MESHRRMGRFKLLPGVPQGSPTSRPKKEESDAVGANRRPIEDVIPRDILNPQEHPPAGRPSTGQLASRLRRGE